MNRLVQFVIDFPVSGIKPIVSGHFEIFLRDMLYQEFSEIDGRKSPFHKRIIFVSVVVESDIFTIIGINPGKGDDRTTEIAADIFDNGIWIAKIGLGINVKTVFVFAVYLIPRDNRPFVSAIPFSYKIAFNFSVSSSITFLSILWNNISTSGSR